MIDLHTSSLWMVAEEAERRRKTDAARYGIELKIEQCGVCDCSLEGTDLVSVLNTFLADVVARSCTGSTVAFSVRYGAGSLELHVRYVLSPFGGADGKALYPCCRLASLCDGICAHRLSKDWVASLSLALRVPAARAAEPCVR